MHHSVYLWEFPLDRFLGLPDLKSMHKDSWFILWKFVPISHIYQLTCFIASQFLIEKTKYGTIILTRGLQTPLEGSEFYVTEDILVGAGKLVGWDVVQGSLVEYLKCQWSFRIPFQFKNGGRGKEKGRNAK